jgi:transglutaminase-like putative cysteine protease
MTWRMSIVHTTTHRYAGAVGSSYNEARIVPPTLARQACTSARVEVEPEATLYQYRDYWGTVVHGFDLHQPHATMTVRGRSTVETTAAPSHHGAPIGWAELGADGVHDRFAELLEPTPYVPRVPRADEIIDALRRTTPDGTAQAVVGWVGENLRYEPGATDVTTSAEEVLARGRGVCQDFAHLTLALLRCAGIPARYVSGYLHPDPRAAVGETVAGQGHAWVEWWGGDWAGWDPTHCEPISERHVIVARGRDYADVVPLKGVYHGAPAASHEVSVAITRTG